MLTRLVKLQSQINSDRGATAVEYAIMVSLIALVIIAAVTAFGLSVSGLFHLITTTAPFN
jgi:pilus assembly protein Flp/PilA